jgi:hypothetical protein
MFKVITRLCNGRNSTQVIPKEAIDKNGKEHPEDGILLACIR